MRKKYYDEHGNEVEIEERPRRRSGCLKMALAIIGVIVLMVIIGVAFTDVDTVTETTESDVEAENITNVEIDDPDKAPGDEPLVMVEELPYDIEIQQPDSIGTVYGITTYTNQSEYPIGSFSLTVNLKDQNDKAYYITHDTVMPGETSPSFDGFAPETMNPEDIEILEINYRVVLDDGSEQSVDYDVKLDRYKTLHIEDPI